MIRSSFWLVAFLLASPSSGSAYADSTQRAVEAGERDASAFREHLSVLTDGEGHYIAVVTFDTAVKDHKEAKVGRHLYYGDGERFYAQRSSGGSSSGNDKRFTRNFWAPRALGHGGGSFNGKGDVYTLECGDRKTAFTTVDPEARKATLKVARFFPSQWQRHAYVLARDDEGTYYYVDRARSPPNNYDFNLYRGPRGHMKPLALVNIVSDSQGDIFASKRGRLRLVLTRPGGQQQRSWQWIAGKRRTELVDVPVRSNVRLIYRDLGVYDGQRMGTPCDDL